jgi:hypothetical protein
MLTILSPVWRWWWWCTVVSLYEGGNIATPALWVLTFVPMFNFAKAVFDINNKSFALGSVTGQGLQTAAAAAIGLALLFGV